MGGIHPTVLPGETLQHADAVVIRSVWPVLAILLAGVIIITYVLDVTLLVVHLLQ